MGEHTPGPWATDQVAGGFNVGIARDYPSWCRIARVGAELSEVAETQDWPNARLIAAAPDLLAAAQDTVDQECDPGECEWIAPSGRSCDGVIECAVQGLRAAIAKAKGEETSHGPDRPDNLGSEAAGLQGKEAL